MWSRSQGVALILSSWIFSVYIGQDLPNRSGLIVAISEILTLLVSHDLSFFFFLIFIFNLEICINCELSFQNISSIKDYVKENQNLKKK